MSIEFCEECRQLPTLHLRVDDGTPSTVLAAAAASSWHNSRKSVSTGVPKLRARSVEWALVSAERLRNPIDVLAEVSVMMLGSAFNDSVEAIAWPVSLHEVTFGYVFNQPIARVRWPASLDQVVFRGAFNQRVSGIPWPGALKQLTLGGVFNQPITGAIWPPSLQELSFGCWFNQPIVGVMWPSYLRRLSFGH